MMLTVMLCATTSLFLTLPKVNNPMSMTLTIIFIALMTASMFCMTLSSWYAFLIFLIYVGGMLVMFAYFTATSPNQQLTPNKKIAKNVMLTFLATATFLVLNKTIPMTPVKSHQLMSLFTQHNMYSLIMITLILLITMIIVVKLSCRSKGPLRAFMT